MHRMKRPQKGTNSFSVFTHAYLEEYRRIHGRPYPGGFQQAIQDEALKNRWDSLTSEQKDEWKERARQQKSRIRSAFVAEVASKVPQRKSTTEEDEGDGYFEGETDLYGLPMSDIPVHENTAANETRGAVAQGGQSRYQANTNGGFNGQSENAEAAYGFKSYRPETANVNSGFGASSQNQAGNIGAEMTQDQTQVSSLQTAESIYECPGYSDDGSDETNVPHGDAIVEDYQDEDRGLAANPKATQPNATANIFGADQSFTEDTAMAAGAEQKKPQQESEHQEAGKQIGMPAATHDQFEDYAEPMQQFPIVQTVNADAPPIPATQNQATNAADASMPTGMWTQEFREAYMAQMQMPRGHRGIGRGMHLLPSMAALINTVNACVDD